tara:strand:- start:4087 stop:4533 length:447 start_codon:yes stop_codon:yes gene_type:complete
MELFDNVNGADAYVGHTSQTRGQQTSQMGYSVLENYIDFTKKPTNPANTRGDFNELEKNYITTLDYDETQIALVARQNALLHTKDTSIERNTETIDKNVDRITTIGKEVEYEDIDITTFDRVLQMLKIVFLVLAIIIIYKSVRNLRSV